MAVSQDAIARMRTLAEEIRSRRLEVVALEQKLKDENARINQIEFDDLVELMQDNKVKTFELEAEGNYPALCFGLDTYYRAAIPVSWEEQRRELAFAALPDDLIKVTVKAFFAKGELAMANTLAAELLEAGHTVSVDKEVHHSTLKAWLKTQFENGGEVPDLETIGAFVAPRVKVEEVK